MVYETFLENIQLAVADQLGGSFSVSLQQIPKNNGVLSDSLCIQKPPAPVSAAIYLSHFFEEYQKGASMPDIVSEILHLYDSHTLPPDFMPEQFLSFQSCKSQLACKLIHTSQNHSILSNIPHIPFLDLSIVFYIFTENNDEVFTSLVNNSQLSLWNVSLDELFAQAKANSMALFPPVIKELEDIVENLAPPSQSTPVNFQDNKKETVPPLQEERPLIYVLTNIKGVNGAYAMLYPGVLESFSQAVSTDLIIIPSSIHEVLLIPQDPSLDYNDMNATVKEINQSEVPIEEHLSDHVYFYSRSSGRIFLPSGISAALP